MLPAGGLMQERQPQRDLLSAPGPGTLPSVTQALLEGSVLDAEPLPADRASGLTGPSLGASEEGGGEEPLKGGGGGRVLHVQRKRSRQLGASLRPCPPKTPGTPAAGGASQGGEAWHNPLRDLEAEASRGNRSRQDQRGGSRVLLHFFKGSH